MFSAIDAQTLYKSSPLLHLTWSPNKETNLKGYYLSYGTESGQYTNKTNIVPTTNIVIPFLEVGKKYYVVVRAVNNFMMVSEPSDPILVEIVDKGFPLSPIKVEPAKPTRYIDVLQSLDGKPYKSIGKVPYPVVANQQFKDDVITENGVRYINVKMSTNGKTFKSIGKIPYPVIPKTKQVYKTVVSK